MDSKSVTIATALISSAVLIATTVDGFIIHNQSDQLDRLNGAAARDKVFTEDIFSQINALSGGGPKAKMVFVGLWVLAQSDKEARDSLTVLASASGDDGLKAVASQLTPNVSLQDLNSSTHLLDAQAALGQQLSVSVPAKFISDPLPTGNTANLLADLTPQGSDGYVYLGTADPNTGKFVAGATSSSVSVPTPGQSIAISTDLHLRGSYPVKQELGDVKGIVNRGSILRVDEVKPIRLSSSRESVWAKITIANKPNSAKP